MREVLFWLVPAQHPAGVLNWRSTSSRGSKNERFTGERLSLSECPMLVEQSRKQMFHDIKSTPGQIALFVLGVRHAHPPSSKSNHRARSQGIILQYSTSFDVDATHCCIGSHLPPHQHLHDGRLTHPSLKSLKFNINNGGRLLRSECHAYLSVANYRNRLIIGVLLSVEKS